VIWSYQIFFDTCYYKYLFSLCCFSRTMWGTVREMDRALTVDQPLKLIIASGFFIFEFESSEVSQKKLPPCIENVSQIVGNALISLLKGVIGHWQPYLLKVPYSIAYPLKNSSWGNDNS
jgi:hypothetical protein